MLGKLFGRDETERKESETSTRNNTHKFAPNTKIAYKSTLIAEFEKDHVDLLELFEQASEAAQTGADKRSKLLLSQFKGMFVDHILRENTSLYLYLKHTAHGEASQKALRSIKLEMEKIASEVMRFLDHAIKESTPIDDDFLQRMSQASEKIHKRIRHEEDHVYPIYRSKNRVSDALADQQQA